MSDLTNKENQQEEEKSEISKGNEALVHTLKVLFLCLRILMIFVFLYLPFSGVFRLEQQQNAMLFRFGRLVEKNGQEILTPGVWYWAFPAPIDRVEKINALKTTTLSSYTYWPRRSKISLTDKNGKLREDLADLDSKQDGYLLTGDGYIMHMAWSMSYKVTSPKHYFLNYYSLTEGSENQAQGIEQLLLSILDDAVLSEVSGWSVEEVIKRSRIQAESGITETLTQAVRRSLLAKLNALNPQVGIELQEVNLLNVVPPVALSEAFNGVQTADQDQARLIQAARTYEAQVVSETTASAVQQRTAAHIDKERTIALAKTKADNFSKILSKYQENPQVTVQSLYADAVRDMLKRCREKYQLTTSKDGDEVRIMVPRVKSKDKPKDK